MAFTVAHMAAAIPFKRCRWLCLEAVFIGTMMPDLPYYISSSSGAAQVSHQWLGLMSYCLPWGLLVFALWYWLFKPAVIGLMQPWFDMPCWDNSITQNHRAPYNFKSWLVFKLIFWSAFWSKVAFGLLIGAITHLLWDGITHPSGFIAQQVGWLQYPLSIGTLGADIKVARILQYLSSLVGLLLLVKFAWSNLKAQYNARSYLTTKSSTAERTKINFFGKVSGFKKWHSVLVIVLICLNALYWGWQEAEKRQHFITVDNYTFLAEISVSLLQGAMIAFILYAVIYQLIYRIRYELTRH
jgi:hypothetical protein